jgi:hypothetical protein
MIINSAGADYAIPCYACPVISGDVMLTAFDMPASDKALNIGCVVIFWVGFRFLAYLSLRYKNWIRK